MHFRRIRDLREDNDLKQSDIALILQTTQQQYSMYERGEREMPMSMFIILAKYYKVSLDYIAGITNDKRGIGYSKSTTINNINNQTVINNIKE